MPLASPPSSERQGSYQGRAGQGNRQADRQTAEGGDSSTTTIPRARRGGLRELDP
ncbi:hypothetical protein LY78DRAFT_662380 [Colletotrichum sublineola]|nr:hypothetical protein LY78DRAFT_662380 [Colletotrichum sublineola]